MGRDEPTNLQLHSWQSAGDCYRRHSQLHHVRDFRSALFRIAGSRGRAFGIDPYIGAAAVTVPVAIVALFQWGLTPQFYTLLIAYGIIQALDGNVLVPVLFSEAVNLHPVAIIIAVLVFGGLWGFWGVFFAIPLATLVKAVWKALPSIDEEPAS